MKELITHFSFLVCFTVFLQIELVQSQEFDPWTPGPYNTKHHYFTKEYLNETGGFHHHHVDLWVPKTRHSDIVQDTYPVLYFLPGLTDLLPAWLIYHQFFEQIASHGIVVIAPWTIKPEVGIIDTIKAPWIDDVVDYFDKNLNQWLQDHGLEYINPDLEHPFLAGHSSSCDQVVEHFKTSCGKFVGQILLSPVDMAFTGIDALACITEGEYLNYATPTLIAMAGLDPLLSQGNFINNTCAPERFSNERFLDAMSGPTWFLNATEYGHGDFLDPFFYDAMEWLHFCATDPSTDKDIYRKFVTGEIASFIEVVYRGNCDAIKYVEDTNIMPVHAAMECNTPECKVEDICGNPYCVHQ